VLLASESTVQVLSPTVIVDVIYSTIQTLPSGVIAGIPIPASLFTSDLGATQLSQLAGGVEAIMAMPMVTAGRGTQTIDPNGLIADEITFVVEYVPPGPAGTAITADAVIPVSILMPTLLAGETPSLETATAIINSVYANLVSMAGG
jgi:hypothetical protein